MKINESVRIQAAAAEAEATRNEPLPPNARGTRINRSVPIAVRVSSDVAAEVEQLASQLEVTTSELIRGWISQGLAERRESSVTSAIDQLQADLNRLRNIVA